MKVLIFDDDLTGHHLEYLHHLFMGAVADERSFVFLVPSKFSKYYENEEWPKSPNVTVLYLTDSEFQKCVSGSPLFNAYHKARIIGQKAKQCKTKSIWLISLFFSMPFLLWFAPSKVKIRGIVYQIYLRNNKITNLRLLLERIRYWLIVKSHKVEKVFILNDKQSASQLNKNYKTNKFQVLADPVPDVDLSSIRSVREKLGINEDSKMFLHFGHMEDRKGTLEILRGIIEKPNVCKNWTFVFAGKVQEDIKTEFFDLVNIANGICKILVFDQFCSYSFLYELCHSTNVILLPYKIAYASSGVIGYAALFKKQVIGPSSGLIGDLINDYKLGIAIDTITPSSIISACKSDFIVVDNDYCIVNSKSNFIFSLMS